MLGDDKVEELANHAAEAWQEHREALLRFVISRGIESHDAEDIVHDVLLKAIAPGGGPAEPLKLRAWLYQVVRNAIVDHHRRKRPQEQLSEYLADIKATGNHPDLLLACLEPFLSRLSPDDAEVLRQVDIENIPQALIASRLGLGMSATKSRIQRARKKVLTMYRVCCQVELDRQGRLVDYVDQPCSEGANRPSDSGCHRCSGNEDVGPPR